MSSSAASSAVAKQSGEKDVAAPGSGSGGQAMMESKEYNAKAEGSAGLNLNLAGAVSGLFSSKSKKETAADGSSVEHKEEKASGAGSGAGNATANAAASAEEKGKQMRGAIQEGKN